MKEVLSNIDATAWALMFISVSINLVTVVIQYKYRVLPSAVLAVILIVGIGLLAGGVWLAYVGYGRSAGQQQPPREPNREDVKPPPQPPGIESIFPPQSAIDIRPMPGARTVSFILADWVSWSASNIAVSTWMSTGGAFQQIGTHKYDYLGNGDSVQLTEPVAPQTPSKVALCISYVLNKHRVEAIHFFSNADSGGYRRARDSIFEVDGPGRLCNSMPRPAQGAF